MAKKTLKYWKNKIDKVFHEYIRRRDADNNTGYCNCITCKNLYILQKAMLVTLYQGVDYLLATTLETLQSVP